MYKLRRFLKDYKKECIIGPLCKLFEAILELFVPLVMANIIDVGIKNRDAGYVWAMGGLLVLLALLGWSSAMFTQYFASKASQGAGTKIRRALFRHINTLSHAELDKLGTPSLITRITNDTNTVQQSIAMMIRLLTRAPFIIAGSLVMAMTINLKLSLIFFGAAVLIALTLYLVMTRSVPIFSAMQKKLDVISLISRENLSGNRVIRAFSKQKTACKRMDDATEDLARTSIRVSRLSALLSPVTYAVTDIAIILIVWFGAIDVDLGGMQTGDIVALVSYMRINQVFETVPRVQEKNTEPIETDETAPKIEFEHVCFNYNDDGDDELTDVSFAVPRGATIGVIGGTGSGKSTLVNLIPRFYDVNSGCVRVDGRDVRDYPFAQLRRQIGMVPQQSTLFSGTVRDNLRWRKPDATDEELLAALQTAQALEFVQKLPKGLDSRVEQGGRNFSGGQRQRLCIARALVNRPDLLILDDSFSALDLATDAALRKALRETTDGMTVLIVTQRCSTVRNADLILVVSDGELAGVGTHDELTASCTVYRDICLSQQTEKEAAR